MHNISNLKGVILACVSSAFIGSSFIIKKKGLKRAGVAGIRAVIVGEIANFVAYIYAPAVLVTPLGALSIICGVAHCLLNEKLQKMGMLGCLLCIVGSTVIVLHAPGERSIDSVDEIWELAIQPAFLLYTASVVAVALVLILFCAPRYGQTNIMIYISICSIIGSLTVMSVKAIGIAIKLTLDGANQFKYFHAWVFAMVSVTCIIIQLNYLNMVVPLSAVFFFGIVMHLIRFNTALVSPIYYALFTSFTILASAIMFKDYYGQSISSIASELCGFITVLSGTAILHSTREPDQPYIADMYTPLSPKVSWQLQSNGELWKQRDDDVPSSNCITILQQDYSDNRLNFVGKFLLLRVLPPLCDGVSLYRSAMTMSDLREREKEHNEV
ncbi:putative magnesium transporter NIPA6 [Bienertia sinuspersici]